MNVLLFLILGMLIFGLAFPAFIFIAGILPLVLVAAVALAILIAVFFVCKFVLAALLFMLAFAMLALMLGLLPLTLVALPILALMACFVGGSYIFACKNCG